MSRLSILALCALSLPFAGSVGAQTAPAPAQAVAPAPDDAASIDIVAKKLCQAEPIIGTRIPVQRKCNTPAQLKAYQAQAREIIENYRRRPCMMGAESANNQPMPC